MKSLYTQLLPTDKKVIFKDLCIAREKLLEQLVKLHIQNAQQCRKARLQRATTPSKLSEIGLEKQRNL